MALCLQGKQPGGARAAQKTAISTWSCCFIVHVVRWRQGSLKVRCDAVILQHSGGRLDGRLLSSLAR